LSSSVRKEPSITTVPIVLSILLGLAFLAAGLAKLAGAAQSRDRMAHLRLPCT